MQKNGKSVEPTTGGEVSGGRRLEQRGSGLSGSRVGAIELLLGGTKGAEQSKAGAQNYCLKRGTSPVWLPPNYGAHETQGQVDQRQRGATGSAPGRAPSKRTPEKDSSSWTDSGQTP